MRGDLLLIYDVLVDHEVPAVIIGGHAVNFHGYLRATEDVDIIFVRTVERESALVKALESVNAFWIGDKIDPVSGLEETFPVTESFVKSNRLMMLGTDHGYLDLFDHVPGLPEVSATTLVAESVLGNGRRYASLKWLRRMKQASARPIDLNDLEMLPRGDD